MTLSGSDDGATDSLAISLSDLAWAFLLVGAQGFGGVAVSAHRVLVDDRKWLNEAEYAAMLGVGQALPGANTINLAVMLGDRVAGWRGAVTAVCSLMGAPVAILAVILSLYERFAIMDAAAGALGGVASAGAGLTLSVAIRLFLAAGRKRYVGGLALAAFAGVILGVPLLAVVFGVGTLGFAWAAVEPAA